MATRPSVSAEPDNARPPHQRADGFASSAPTTSRVTSAVDLLPPMSGTRTMATPLAIASLPAGGRGPVVPHQLHITDRRLRVELVEDAVGPLARRAHGDPAVRIVKVAEDDRLRRTRLLARRLNGPVRERDSEALGLDFVLFD